MEDTEEPFGKYKRFLWIPVVLAIAFVSILGMKESAIQNQKICAANAQVAGLPELSFVEMTDSSLWVILWDCSDTTKEPACKLVGFGWRSSLDRMVSVMNLTISRIYPPDSPEYLALQQAFFRQKCD